MKRERIVALFVLVVIGFSLCSQAESVEDWMADGRYSYRIKSDNTVEIVDFNDYWDLGFPPPIIIHFPSTINGRAVTSIGDTGNGGPLSLKKIHIPGSIKRIGKMCFSDCEKLETVIFEEGIEEIGDCAFAGCASLFELMLPASVIMIGANPFLNCGEVYQDNDSSYQFSLSLSEDNKSFSFNDDLLISSKEKKLIYCAQSKEGTVLLNDVEVIGNSAFSCCESIDAIILPEGLVSIGARAFERCYGIKDIVIPEGVERIGSEAFSMCTHLESIFIPSSVTDIAERSFYGCDKLTIYAEEGSFAMQYALKNNISCRDIK